MKRVFVPTQSASDWQRLLAKPELHWKQGKSAMTAAAAWEAAGDQLPPEITTYLDSSGITELADLQLLAAIPEWQVALPGGDRPSCTDILALARNVHGLCVLAVEAKVDEDFGPRLAEKRKEASAGQVQRIEFLQDLLGTKGLDDRIRYQLLHRTASALLTAKQFHAGIAVMLVQSFGQRAELKTDFNEFLVALGAQPTGSNLKSVPGHNSPKLFLGWCDGDPEFVRARVAPASEYLVR